MFHTLSALFTVMSDLIVVACICKFEIDYKAIIINMIIVAVSN